MQLPAGIAATGMYRPAFGAKDCPDAGASAEQRTGRRKPTAGRTEE